MVNRVKALRALGGRVKAAQLMGVRPKSISDWATDEHDNFVSREVCDKVVAALFRENARRMVEEGLQVDVETHWLELPQQGS